MNFDSLADFAAMGGHGLYVWLSYGVALLVVAANLLAVSLGQRNQLRELRDWQLRSGQLRGGQGRPPPTAAGPDETDRQPAAKHGRIRPL